MRGFVRFLLLVSGLLICLTFFFPLWRFELWAPQYPEGLSMQVWSYKLTGSVQNINILNHYVGMKPIEADSLSELRYFPYLLGAFAVLGVLGAIVNKRRFAITWAVLLLVFSVAALYDFYHWEYKFGHELSDDAPIKVEGMAYQPPFIGSRTLLTITAKSLPSLGGMALAAAVLIACLALVLMLRQRNSRGRASVGILALCAAPLFLLSYCQASSGSEPILFGEEPCHTCKMVITDKRFGGEIRTTKGKLLKFDSLDCLVPFYQKNKEIIDSVWVIDSFQNGQLIKAQEAHFARVQALHSPMGSGVLSSLNPDALAEAAGGTPLMDWAALQSLYPGS